MIKFYSKRPGGCQKLKKIHQPGNMLKNIFYKQNRRRLEIF